MADEADRADYFIESVIDDYIRDEMRNRLNIPQDSIYSSNGHIGEQAIVVESDIELTNAGDK